MDTKMNIMVSIIIILIGLKYLLGMKKSSKTCPPCPAQKMRVSIKTPDSVQTLNANNITISNEDDDDLIKPEDILVSDGAYGQQFQEKGGLPQQPKILSQPAQGMEVNEPLNVNSYPIHPAMAMEPKVARSSLQIERVNQGDDIKSIDDVQQMTSDGEIHPYVKEDLVSF